MHGLGLWARAYSSLTELCGCHSRRKPFAPAYLPAAAEGGPVPVSARLRVPVVQVAVIRLARRQDDQGRVETGKAAPARRGRRPAPCYGDSRGRCRVQGRAGPSQAPAGVSGSLARAVSCRPGGRSERPGRAGRPAPGASLRGAATREILCREGSDCLACRRGISGRMASVAAPPIPKGVPTPPPLLLPTSNGRHPGTFLSIPREVPTPPLYHDSQNAQTIPPRSASPTADKTHYVNFAAPGNPHRYWPKRNSPLSARKRPTETLETARIGPLRWEIRCGSEGFSAAGWGILSERPRAGPGGLRGRMPGRNGPNFAPGGPWKAFFPRCG